jgi:hypothetical protein
MLLEVLELVRAQQKALATPEELFPPEYFRWIMHQFNPDPDILGDVRSGVHHLRKILSEIDELEGNPRIEEAIAICRRLDFLVNEIPGLERKIRRTVRRPASATEARIGDTQKG